MLEWRTGVEIIGESYLRILLIYIRWVNFFYQNDFNFSLDFLCWSQDKLFLLFKIASKNNLLRRLLAQLTYGLDILLRSDTNDKY